MIIHYSASVLVLVMNLIGVRRRSAGRVQGRLAASNTRPGLGGGRWHFYILTKYFLEF